MREVDNWKKKSFGDEFNAYIQAHIFIIVYFRYTRGTGTENLERLSEEKRQLEIKVEGLQEKRSDTDKKILDIEKQILDRKGTERGLTDHIRHRALKKELAECRLKLNELKGQRSRFERASYERQMETHKARQEELIAEVNCLYFFYDVSVHTYMRGCVFSK